ncbi:MAG: PilZ domain-containing protein [Bdellovibrionales bacterium]
MSDSKVIDMTARRQAQISEETTSQVYTNDISDMTERRMEIVADERRLVRRTILSEFIGAYAVLPEQGLAKVAVYDISEQGMAVDIDTSFGSFREGEEIAMRIYLSNTTFMPFIARVYNCRQIPEEGVHRHGVAFVKDTLNNDALKHFVNFLESVSASLRTDKGDVIVSKFRS